MTLPSSTRPPTHRTRKIAISQPKMSSRLEKLPPEIFRSICETIDKSPGHKRQHHQTFINLSLASKICRSYTTPYIFRRLYFVETRLGFFIRSLGNCIATLERLDILHHVKGIDVAIGYTKTTRKAEKKSILESFKKLPNLGHLDFQAPSAIYTAFFGGDPSSFGKSLFLRPCD